MIEWITLRGEGPAITKWLVWARKQARFMVETGIRPTKRLRMADGTTVAIEIRDGQAFIRVAGGGVFGGYQFIGTGPTRMQDFLDDDVAPLVRYLPRVYAVLATHQSAGWIAKPLVTGIEEPPTPEAWVFDADPRATNDYLHISPAHHPDGHGVFPFFPASEDRPALAYPWLLSQWCQAWPCHALSYYSGGQAAASRWAPIDAGYDYPPVVFSGPPPAKGAYKRIDTDWPQRGCLRFVDGRTFVIVADVNSVFHCFPLGAETGDGAGDFNIPEEVLQSVPCPWPDWVTVELLGQDEPDIALQRRRLRPRWVYCQDGTKAACVTAHRADPWEDAYFTSSLYLDNGVYVHNLQEDYPGVVEVEFAIEITGETLEDFTFGVAVRQVIYSRTTGRYPVAVGYALREMGDVLLNDFLVLEYEFYSDNPSCAVAPNGGATISPVSPTVTPESGWKIPQRPAFAGVANVVRQATLDAPWTSVRRWLAYYAVFPTERTYGSYQEPRPFYPRLEEIPDVPFDETWYDNHFVFIAHLNSFDISSLAFSLSATIRTQGDTPRVGGGLYGCEVNRIETIVWNEIKDSIDIGYDFLKPIVADYLHLKSSYPDLGAMTRIYPAATLDYAYYGMASVNGKNCDSATLVVRDGHPTSESTYTSVLARAYFNGGLAPDRLAEFVRTAVYPLFNNCPLLEGATRSYYPAVYSFFDGFIRVRPGIRWTKTATDNIASAVWEDGEPSFSNYPYGIVMASRVFNLTCAPAGAMPDRGIHTHVQGSWSIYCGPFACQKTVVNYSDDVPNNFEQTVIDKIALEDPLTKKTVYSTHLSLLNAAFQKEFTASDFYFTFRKRVGENRPEFNPQVMYPTDLGWHFVNSCPLGVGLVTETILGMFPYFFPCFENTFNNLSVGGFGSPIRFAFPSPRLESLFFAGKSSATTKVTDG